MPVFDNVSEEILIAWLLHLQEQLDELKNFPNEDLLCYFMLKLYEYLQCRAKLDSCEETELSNVKITVKDIKSKPISKDYMWVVNKLQTIRNDVGHKHSEDLISQILALLTKEAFYEFAKEFGLDSTLTDLIHSVVSVFISKNELTDSCMIECKNKVQSLKGTDEVLSSIYYELYSKYPRSIVNECLLIILGDEYVV